MKLKQRYLRWIRVITSIKNIYVLFQLVETLNKVFDLNFSRVMVRYKILEYIFADYFMLQGEQETK